MDRDHDCCMISKKPSQLGRLERQPDALVMVGLVVCYLGDELGPFKLNYLTICSPADTYQIRMLHYVKPLPITNMLPKQNKQKMLMERHWFENSNLFKVSFFKPNQFVNHLSSHLLLAQKCH